MKDVIFYVFVFLLYGLLVLGYIVEPKQADLTWKYLGQTFVSLALAATLARWTVLAFKKRPDRLLAGQKIVGIEEGDAPSVLEVVKPQKLKREDKKPKLKRRRL